jgi:hypothetical protein
MYLYYARVNSFWILSYLHGLWARPLITALLIGVAYFGPLVFGQDWYYGGFEAGVVLGIFAAWAFGSSETGQNKQKSEVVSNVQANHEPKARAILTLEYEEQGDRRIEIEDPPVIPMIGDQVSFADLHRTVVERSIEYCGSSGPDRQSLITVMLRQNPERRIDQVERIDVQLTGLRKEVHELEEGLDKHDGHPQALTSPGPPLLSDDEVARVAEITGLHFSAVRHRSRTSEGRKVLDGLVKEKCAKSIG